MVLAPDEDSIRYLELSSQVLKGLILSNLSQKITSNLSIIIKTTKIKILIGQPASYTYPKVEDYRVLVLKVLSCGSFICPASFFNKLAMVWHVLFIFFFGLAFSLRHSGLNGQWVTDAVAWIHSRLGLEKTEEVTKTQTQIMSHNPPLRGIYEPGYGNEGST